MRVGGWQGWRTAGPGGPPAGTWVYLLRVMAISAKPSGLGSVVELIYPAPLGAGGPVRAPSIQSWPHIPILHIYHLYHTPYITIPHTLPNPSAP